MLKNKIKCNPCSNCSKLIFILILNIFIVVGCSGSDYDSGGLTTFYRVDSDGDGYPAGQGDCNDSNRAIHPDKTEICDDGIDNDCDGATDCADTNCAISSACLRCIDNDSDGYKAESGCGTEVDCNDSDSAINPGTTDKCDDSVDNNCDGVIDEEGCSLSPRFTDMGDGTVRDNNTGLIWLKDANAFGTMTWANALNAAADLSSGEKGLSDGSVVGDWRLPTKEEWEAFVSRYYNQPALVNTEGDAQWSEGDAFTEVQFNFYWSSTEYDSFSAWGADIHYGYIYRYRHEGSDRYFVWPIRSGN